MNTQTLENLFNEMNNVNKPVAFMAFAKQHDCTGKMDFLKEPLYKKTHKDTGEVEDVKGIRLETKNGFVLLALSRNAAKMSLDEIAKSASTMQIRESQYNGYQNFTLCTGQSDRETSGETATFTIA